MFLGLDPAGLCLSPVAFTPPVKSIDKTSATKITSRMKLNFAFFLTNYVLVASMVTIVVALMHPGMIFFLGIVWGLWKLHAHLIKNQLILFGLPVHSLLSVQQRFYVLFVITSIVVVMKCLAPTLFVVIISSLIILLHAFLRDPKHIEQSSSDSDDEEDVGGGHSSGSESGVVVEVPPASSDSRSTRRTSRRTE